MYTHNFPSHCTQAIQEQWSQNVIVDLPGQTTIRHPVNSVVIVDAEHGGVTSPKQSTMYPILPVLSDSDTQQCHSNDGRQFFVHSAIISQFPAQSWGRGR